MQLTHNPSLRPLTTPGPPIYTGPGSRATKGWVLALRRSVKNAAPRPGHESRFGARCDVSIAATSRPSSAACTPMGETADAQQWNLRTHVPLRSHGNRASLAHDDGTLHPGNSS